MTYLIVCKDLIKVVSALYMSKMEEGILVLPNYRTLQVATEGEEEVAWVAQTLNIPVPKPGTPEYRQLERHADELIGRIGAATELLVQNGKLEEGIYTYHGIKGFKPATPRELEDMAMS